MANAGDATKRLRLLWISCGDKDRLMDISRNIRAALEKKKVPHFKHGDAGGHERQIWKNDLYLLSPMQFRDR